MQISYHFALTKIQRLQNLKNNNNKKKTFFLYRPVCPIPVGIVRNWPVRPVFFPVRNMGVNRTGLLAGTAYTCRYGTVLTPYWKASNIAFESSLFIYFSNIIA